MKMSDDDLLAFLNAESDSAYSQTAGQLAEERARAYREYLRLPYGNETANASQVVASDVFDSVEGMLPDLIEVFASTDEAVRFDPVGPEDEEGAQQATDACNYVFYKQNNGFLILYSAAKDALMMKTGGVKWFWEEKRVPSFATYKMDELQLALWTMQNPKGEILSQEDVEPEPQDPNQPQAPQFGQLRLVRVKTVETKGCVRVVPIPPDELLISNRHNSILLDECPYVAHVTKRTLSDIHQMGFKEVTEADVRSASTGEQPFTDRELKNQLLGLDEGHDPIGGAMVQGWFREEYVLVDFDGDGIAERRKVMRLGDKVLENEEFSHVPMAAWTPYILTHQFQGISVADLVSDFQRINTDVWRQSLDNLYLANNQNTVVLTDANGAPKANIDDLLNRFPGSILRESMPNAIRPYVERWQGVEAGPMLELVQGAKENRTGYTRYSQGLDADSLNKTAHGIQQIMNASQKRMKLMARIMAEALVAPMFRGIFKTLTDYCMEKLAFRLNGKFVQYDPQEWRDGYDMSINVGIGSGDKLQQMQFLGSIEAAQGAMVQGGGMGKLITPQNLYNLQKRKVELAGFKDPGEFFTDPATIPPEPPKPPPVDPKVQVKQMELTADQQKFQAEQQADEEKTQKQFAFDAAQKQLDRQLQIVLKAMDHKQSTNATAMGLESEKSAKAEKDASTDGVMQALEMLAKALSAPKRIISDGAGNAVGVVPVLE
jgi:hypothetical protein